MGNGQPWIPITEVDPENKGAASKSKLLTMVSAPAIKRGTDADVYKFPRCIEVLSILSCIE